MFRFAQMLSVKTLAKKKQMKSSSLRASTHVAPSTPNENDTVVTTDFAVNNSVPATPQRINRLDGTKVFFSPRGNKDHAIGKIKGENVIILGEKPFGIEPGFLFVIITNDLITWVNAIRQDKLPLTDFESLRNFCKNNRDEAKKIFSQIKIALMSGQGYGNVKLYMCKGNYYDPPFWTNNVSPEIDRLINSGTMAKILQPFQSIALLAYASFKKFTGNRSTVNCNNWLECLATEQAQDYGLKTQEIKINISFYKDNFPKVMPICTWEPQLKVFDHCLAGDKGHNKYLVKVKEYVNGKPVFVKKNGYYYSDNSIKNLGMNWAIITLQNDEDKVGSHGQNAGSVGNQLFIYDTGKAHRKPNTLINYLQDDCSIDLSNNPIKNLSVFSDTKLSERMAGVIAAYQISDQKTRNELFPDEQEKIKLVVEEYKKSFPTIDHIVVGAEEQRFDEHIACLKILIKKAHEELDFITKKEYKKYIKAIKKTKETAIASRINMLKVFRERLQLTPEEVDLVDHLEKLCGKTSILSNDGKVILNHLRLLPNEKPSLWQWLSGKQPEKNRIRWSIKQDEQKFILSAIVSEQRYSQIEALLNNYLQHYEVEKILNEHLQQDDKIKNISIQKFMNSDEITLSINGNLDKATQLKLLSAIFDEDNIKLYKHKQEPKTHPAAGMPSEPLEVAKDLFSIVEPMRIKKQQDSSLIYQAYKKEVTELFTTTRSYTSAMGARFFKSFQTPAESYLIRSSLRKWLQFNEFVVPRIFLKNFNVPIVKTSAIPLFSIDSYSSFFSKSQEHTKEAITSYLSYHSTTPSLEDGRSCSIYDTPPPVKGKTEHRTQRTAARKLHF